jgi:hypothetical protein
MSAAGDGEPCTLYGTWRNGASDHPHGAGDVMLALSRLHVSLPQNQVTHSSAKLNRKSVHRSPTYEISSIKALRIFADTLGYHPALRSLTASNHPPLQWVRCPCRSTHQTLDWETSARTQNNIFTSLFSRRRLHHTQPTCVIEHSAAATPKLLTWHRNPNLLPRIPRCKRRDHHLRRP